MTVRWVSRLPDVMNGVSALDWIGGLISQDGFQKVSSDSWVGIQERRPRGVNYINRVRELHRNPSVSPQLNTMNEHSAPHLFSVSLVPRAVENKARTT